MLMDLELVSEILDIWCICWNGGFLVSETHSVYRPYSFFVWCVFSMVL